MEPKQANLVLQNYEISKFREISHKFCEMLSKFQTAKFVYNLLESKSFNLLRLMEYFSAQYVKLERKFREISAIFRKISLGQIPSQPYHRIFLLLVDFPTPLSLLKYSKVQCWRH
jgi:hypothetical protein